MENYSAIKIKEVSAICDNEGKTRDTTLSEVSQTQKAPKCMISFIYRM